MPRGPTRKPAKTDPNADPAPPGIPGSKPDFAANKAPTDGYPGYPPARQPPATAPPPNEPLGTDGAPAPVPGGPLRDGRPQLFEDPNDGTQVYHQHGITSDNAMINNTNVNEADTVRFAGEESSIYRNNVPHTDIRKPLNPGDKSDPRTTSLLGPKNPAGGANPPLPSQARLTAHTIAPTFKDTNVPMRGLSTPNEMRTTGQHQNPELFANPGVHGQGNISVPNDHKFPAPPGYQTSPGPLPEPTGDTPYNTPPDSPAESPSNNPPSQKEVVTDTSEDTAQGNTSSDESPAPSVDSDDGSSSEHESDEHEKKPSEEVHDSHGYGDHNEESNTERYSLEYSHTHADEKPSGHEYDHRDEYHDECYEEEAVYDYDDEYGSDHYHHEEGNSDVWEEHDENEEQDGEKNFDHEDDEWSEGEGDELEHGEPEYLGSGEEEEEEEEHDYNYFAGEPHKYTSAMVHELHLYDHSYEHDHQHHIAQEVY